MDNGNQNRSRLFYYETDIEVQIGDRVCLKRWFRSDRFGVVCYISGISEKHPDLEYEDVKQWAIRFDDGDIGAMGYDPQNRWGQPEKSLTFVERGQCGELTTDEKLY